MFFGTSDALTTDNHCQLARRTVPRCIGITKRFHTSQDGLFTKLPRHTHDTPLRDRPTMVTQQLLETTEDSELFSWSRDTQAYA